MPHLGTLLLLRRFPRAGFRRVLPAPTVQAPGLGTKVWVVELFTLPAGTDSRRTDDERVPQGVADSRISRGDKVGNAPVLLARIVPMSRGHQYLT